MERKGRSPRKKRRTADVVPLSREKILEVAETLIDESGVEQFSMRKLATRVGVTPMSLYWHISNKEELLRGVVDNLAARIELPDRAGGDWREAVVKLMTSFRDQLVRHRNASRLLATNLSPRLLVWANALLELMFEAGFQGAEAVRAQSLLVGYAGSSLLMVVGQTEPPTDPVELRRRFRAALEGLPEESVAALKSLGRHTQLEWTAQDEQFAYGLERILDGLEVEAQRLRRTRDEGSITN